jgi:hypothetical protein
VVLGVVEMKLGDKRRNQVSVMKTRSFIYRGSTGCLGSCRRCRREEGATLVAVEEGATLAVSLIGSMAMLADVRGEDEKTTIPNEAMESLLFRGNFLQSERS